MYDYDSIDIHTVFFPQQTTTMTASSTILLLICSLLIYSSVNAQDCSLTCNNGGICVLGEPGEVEDLPPIASYNNTYDNETDTFEVLYNDTASSIEGMHCECAAGYTGATCDVAHTVCNDGDHVCYHGGECGPADYDTDIAHYVCDCVDAVDEHGVHWIGKHCEHPVLYKCENTNEACVNGGHCTNTE